MDVETVQAILVLGAEFPDASASEILRAVEDGAVEARVVGFPLVECARAALEALLGE